MKIESAFNRSFREDHEEAWTYGTHSNWSLGVLSFHRAWADMVPQYNDTLCDWGSGDGRAARKFKEKKLRVECIDIASNANKHFDGVVHTAPIWNPGLGGKLYALSYCTDVMQYIPPDMVTPTLRIIKRHTVDEAWFAIPYYVKPVPGITTAHLIKTNRPASWWASQFAEVFPRFRFSNEEDRFIVQAFSERL